MAGIVETDKGAVAHLGAGVAAIVIELQLIRSSAMMVVNGCCEAGRPAVAADAADRA